MAKIVIKKRVSLDFLGDEYKESYLTFQSMSIAEYQKLLGEMTDTDNVKSLKLTLDILKRHFLEGKFLDEIVTAEDLDQFDVQTLVSCLEIFTGQQTDPKA